MPLDAGEFDTLFDEWYARLCLFVARIGTREAVVEDIATDAFVVLWERRALIGSREDALKLLYRVARNAALNDVRNERARDRIARGSPDEIGAAAGPSPMSHGPEHDARNADVDRAVRAAIAGLPSVRRQVYTLRWEQGLRSVEIAELLGLSLKTVEMHVTLAHKSLRDALAVFRT